jgi:predicted choloylglycine hydrolase
MREIELRGSYREMGRQQGRILKGMALTTPEPRRLRFAQQCERAMERHAPEMLEELQGLAEAAELDYETLLALSTTAPFDDEELPAANCTVLAVLPERTVDGRPIVGRNYDFFHDVSAEGATTYRTYPAGRYASLGDCDIWVGREDGLNEAGLFVGQAAFFMRGLQPGLTFWFVGRILLDRCATVEEGLALLHQVPYAGSWTYLLADRSGGAAVVEPTAQGVEVRYPEDGLLVMTNHAVCPRWAGKEDFVPPDSHPRYDRLCALLGGERRVDVEMVKAALRDHEGLVCSHGAHFPQRKFGTLWSVVGRPGERQLEIAAGNPCQAAYRVMSF